jgi:hypothetical protein
VWDCAQRRLGVTDGAHQQAGHFVKEHAQRRLARTGADDLIDLMAADLVRRTHSQLRKHFFDLQRQIERGIKADRIIFLRRIFRRRLRALRFFVGNNRNARRMLCSAP